MNKFHCKHCGKNSKEYDDESCYYKGYCAKCISDFEPAIIIYTTEDTLKHKLKDGKSPDHCYWQLKYKPQRLDRFGRSKMYFATEGFIRGYFIIHDIEGDAKGCSSINWFERNKNKKLDNMPLEEQGSDFDKRCLNVELCFYSDSWCALKNPIPIKHFQGFKYADKVEGLND